MALFGGKKPDYKRLEQTEPPEEMLPAMPEPSGQAQAKSPNTIQPAPSATTSITEQEKIALFEWHLARAIEIYQELKTM